MNLAANRSICQAGSDARSRRIVESNDSLIHREHNARPAGRDETAHIWRHAALDGAEMFQGSYRKYEFARHFHSVPAIGVVEAGSMGCYCRGAAHVLPVGTVLLLNPGEVHAPKPADSSKWKFRVFFFEDDFFRTRSLGVAGKVLRFSKPFVEDRRLASSLLRLHRKLETHGMALDLESSMLEIFAQLARRHACFQTQRDDSHAEKTKINRAREYLHAFYGRDITLDELGTLTGLSPYHFVRTFRNSVGLTPHAYLIQIRVEHGRRLLQAGNSISDVAVSTGFADQSHFTRHFKRIMGVTPGQYLPQAPGV